MATEGVNGRSQTSSVSFAPCRLRRGEIPYLRERAAMVARPAIRSRPSARHSIDVEESSLGGASEDARSYWQGRFAACALVERFWHTGRPWNSCGVAPNPTRGAASGLRKGQPKRDEVPPLDPFRAIELVTLPYFFRVFILLFTLYFNLSANDVAPNRSGSPSHSAHVAPISA